MGIDLAAIEAAADRLEGVAVRTPLLRNAALDAMVGAEVFMKPETLQHTGSFKFRGAYNRLVQLSSAERDAGVVAWSSGNHAQGVAAAAQRLGIPATIVMPHDAPQVKAEKTRGYGATIVGYDRLTQDREAIGRQLARERGCVLVPSYDDLDIIAGQGTAGLELAQQTDGAPLDILLICCSGGGLAAGISTAFQALSPSTDIYVVEPEQFNDHERSLAVGKRVSNAPGGVSSCDALLAPKPGALTFPINQKTLTGAVSVSDDDVRQAIRIAYDTLKLVVEPGGAVALAAALTGKVPLAGKRVGVVLSGGNIDPQVFADVISG